MKRLRTRIEKGKKKTASTLRNHRVEKKDSIYCGNLPKPIRAYAKPKGEESG